MFALAPDRSAHEALTLFLSRRAARARARARIKAKKPRALTFSRPASLSLFIHIAVCPCVSRDRRNRCVFTFLFLRFSPLCCCVAIARSRDFPASMGGWGRNANVSLKRAAIAESFYVFTPMSASSGFPWKWWFGVNDYSKLMLISKESQQLNVFS